MGGGDHCCVGPCDNDRRYPDKWVLHSHVHKLQFHCLPKDPARRKQWVSRISDGRDGFKPSDTTSETKVCSNHFIDAKPTTANPNPTLFMAPSDRGTPKKRRKIVKHTTTCTSKDIESKGTVEPAHEFSICTASLQLSREADVKFYTCFKSTNDFKAIFEHLLPKAKNMQYWRGCKQTDHETPSRYDFDESIPMSSTFIHSYGRPGPARKLHLEQEMLLVMMRLRVGLLVHDLAFRFKISTASVSSIFATWIRLMRLELCPLIRWPSKQGTRKELPNCFQKHYPKVRCIIDCTEVFTETPSSLEIQALCWSEYKHHTTIKFLVGITPNGMISYVSPCYGGRASDKFIVQKSGFLNHIEPYDQIMADRGFKIRKDLMLFQATLAIPPSTTGKQQMLGKDVKETSRIANVRIYVEQAIGRLKHFKMLKDELPITCLPLCDDILITCCSLCNLMDPLCE